MISATTPRISRCNASELNRFGLCRTIKINAQRAIAGLALLAATALGATSPAQRLYNKELEEWIAGAHYSQPQPKPESQPKPKPERPPKQHYSRRSHASGRDEIVALENPKDFNQVAEHLQNSKSFASGTYGEVYKARWRRSKDDHDTMLCLKKMRSLSSKKISFRVLHKILREIWIMIYMKHPNTLGLKVLPAPKPDYLKNLWDTGIVLVTDLMDTDLDNLMKTNFLSDEFIKDAAYQILSGLKYIRGGDIIHRDLKPSNILVNKTDGDKYTLKITDFGLSRYWESPHISSSKAVDDEKSSEHPKPKIRDELSKTAQSWYWTAPEVWRYKLMPNQQKYRYNHKCDVWSVGVIIAEMLLTGKPVRIARNLFDDIGTTGFEVKDSLYSNLPKGDKGHKVRRREEYLRRKIRNKTIRKVPADLLTLIAKMLDTNPETRLSAEYALQDPYFNDHRPTHGDVGRLKKADFVDMESSLKAMQFEDPDRRDDTRLKKMPLWNDTRLHQRVRLAYRGLNALAAKFTDEEYRSWLDQTNRQCE